MGRTNGTAFVDITDPVNPVYLGNLPPHSSNSSWRDIKVYADHAFLVSEAIQSGMQVIDLTQLRNVTNPPITFSETAWYNGFLSAHNIVINEDSGFAYAVGTNNCSGGLHMVNIQNPNSPTSAGCYSDDGYTHDAQCVNYIGPDADHQGKEICLNSNEDTLTIVDVSNKSNPIQLSRTSYSGVEYTHQGWLTDDQAYFLVDDELDERNHIHNTRTYVWDLADLDNPVNTGYFQASNSAIDHNQYIRGNYSYQANYRAGLRILDISDVANANLSEVAYFDVYPSSDSANFNGAWSNYPFFDSGLVIVSGIEQGLFILQPNLGSSASPPNVNITNPAEGAAVSGLVTVQIAATDAQDPVGSLNAEWRIDSGSWISATYNSGNGYYEASWDTTSELDGSYVINARATDSDSSQGSDSNNVTVVNNPASFHIASIDLVAIHDRGPRYFGRATVMVEDADSLAVDGVTINGTFTGDWNGSVSGTTGLGGQVILDTPPVKNGSNWTFCVDSAAKNGWIYDSGSDIQTCSGSTAVGQIDGRVVDAGTGSGIPDATVSVNSGQSTTTDGNGDYTLGNVPVGNRTVTASTGGYVSQQQQVSVTEAATSTADFSLVQETGSGATGSIKGTVTNSNGQKLAGVSVETDSGHSAVSNRGGKYTIQNVPEGSRTVTASISGYVSQQTVVQVIAGKTVTVNFILSAP